MGTEFQFGKMKAFGDGCGQVIVAQQCGCT